MHIAVSYREYLEDEQKMLFTRTYPNNVHVYAYIVFQTDKFLEYQKDLFNDFLSQVTELLAQEDLDPSLFKAQFEEQVQDFNGKLGVFAEKIKDVEHIQIKGAVHIFWDWRYMAVLLGSTSVLIFRKQRLVYSVSNQTATKEKIDQFGEFIEGEVMDGDDIIVVWEYVETYLDTEDMQHMVEVSKHNQSSLLDSLIDILSVRRDTQDIWYGIEFNVQHPGTGFKRRLKGKMFEQNRWLSGLKEKLELRRTQTMFIWGGIAVLLLVWWVVSGFLETWNTETVDTRTGLVIDFTIEDIQKDISLFQRIPADSDEKIKKYNEILSKLDLLDEKKKRTFDVKELRKIIEKEYYKGFNIVLFNQDNGFGEPIYTFSPQEKSIMWEVHMLAWRNGLFVWGTQGALVGAVNETLRWTLASISPGTTITDCNLNLLKNGLYCVTDKSELLNIMRTGMLPVTVANGAFPLWISHLATFQSSNFYVVAKSTVWAAPTIYRFLNQKGSQEVFQPGTEYQLAPEVLQNTPDLLSGGLGSIAVDGTFLVWMPEAKELLQLWRQDNAWTLQARRMELMGGDRIRSEYSSETKVISVLNSKYVYLFDPVSQQFTVYRSNPLKTNDAYTTSYGLKYFFSVKFDFGDNKVRDVYLDEGEKSILYILNADNVYSVKLHEMIESFVTKEAEEQAAKANQQ